MILNRFLFIYLTFLPRFLPVMAAPGITWLYGNKLCALYRLPKVKYY